MTLELQAEKRTVFGKKLDSFRKNGQLPAILYGPKEEAEAIFISLKDFKKAWHEGGESTVIQLKIGNSQKNVLIQDVALDPKKDEPVHVDFYVVQMDKPIEAAVPLVFDGVSPAVKDLGGILVKVVHEVQVEALPKNLPHELSVDISKLANLGDKILLKDIILPVGTELKADPEETIALIETPREEEVSSTEDKIAFEEIEIAGKKEKESGEGEEEKNLNA